MKTKKLLTTFTLVMVVLFSACKKDKFVENVGVCPLVVSTNPTNGATSMPLNLIVTATFNEKMNPATINSSSFTIQGGAKSSETTVEGTVTYDGSTATFTLSSPLTSNATYTGRIKSSVRDLAGNALQADYVWTFSTGTVLAPAVISTDPLNNATGVALNKIVTATFSGQMNPLTINTTTFTVQQGGTPVSGTVSYTGTTASFVPSANLMSNTFYIATITTGAMNNSGTPIVSNYIWSFTTGTLIAPTVISTDPINNATGVSLNKIISATFSASMDPLTVTSENFTLKHGTTAVAGTVSYIGATASFIPSGSLLSGITYTATVTTGVTNLTGTPLANNYVWSFTTITHTGPVIVDLGSVERFGIIAGVGVSNNAGLSEIHDMDVGISPGVRSSVTGFPPAIIVNGAIYASDDITPPGIAAMLIQAKQDLTDAYLFAEAATFPAPATVSGDIGGTTLAPGIYKSTSTLLIQSGDLTLDAQGDGNAVWIFQVASDFTTVGGAGGNVILIGSAQAKNVFWQVGSSATIGDYTSFKGNILALTSITMNAYSTAVGRMLCRNGAIVLTSTNIINKP